MVKATINVTVFTVLTDHTSKKNPIESYACVEVSFVRFRVREGCQCRLEPLIEGVATHPYSNILRSNCFGPSIAI